MPTTFNIKVISDPVCPQCYIAKKRLDRAIELYQRVIPNGKHDIFKISWHAYYLANNKDSPAVLTGAVSAILPLPTTTAATNTVSCDIKTETCTTTVSASNGGEIPGNGKSSKSNNSNSSIPIQEAITRRFGGSSSTAQAMQSRLRTKGQMDGINFSFGSRIGSSRDAHRLIYLAGIQDREQPAAATFHQQQNQEEGDEEETVDNEDMHSHGGGRQTKVVDELFKRYFEQDGDITSHEMLIDVAQQAGLNGDEARVWLASDKGGQEVDREAQEAVTKHGITGVPVIFINDTVRIDGAQDVEDFFMEFVRVREEDAGAKN